MYDWMEGMPMVDGLVGVQMCGRVCKWVGGCANGWEGVQMGGSPERVQICGRVG